MTGQYDRIEPLDEQDIIDMRREVTVLREQVATLVRIATHMLGGEIIVRKLAETQPQHYFEELDDINKALK